MNAWEKFKKNVFEDENLVRIGDRILISVSGGPDSICLMHLLWRLKKILPIDLYALNIDHGLRKESKKESKLVEKVCQNLKIPFIVKKIPVKKHSESNKVSIETAGRILRYKELHNSARKLKCNKIATGHNANDNAETLLMWLIRGVGNDGLSGIPVTRKLDERIRIIRPILPVSRDEIIEYAKSQKLRYCIDKSNYSLDFTRNKIRHQLLSLLQKYNPKILDRIFSLTKIVSINNKFLDKLVAQELKKSVKYQKNRISLDLKAFIGYNKAVQLRLLKAILPEKCSFFHIERILKWGISSSKDDLLFSRFWTICKTQRQIVFKKHNIK